MLLKSKKKFDFFAIFLLFAGLIALQITNQGMPGVKSLYAPPREFSAERAKVHVREISKKIHPTGSRENREVKEYIIGVLRSLGIKPEVQRTFVQNSLFPNIYFAGNVENIVAHLPGKKRGRAILFVSHYDSMYSSYGACDDGAGVAAALEAIRAIKAGYSLKNDLIFLFTDGEESGLLGAGAFFKEHPLMKNIKYVFNFEARGCGGPAIMFETGRQDGEIVSDFIRFASYPVGNSLTNAIYNMLPNDTDFSIFKRAGMSGLNFAFIEKLPFYHTPLDKYENLEPQSLQHHGENILSLANYFGDLDTKSKKKSDLIYFRLFGNAIVSFDSGLIPIFMLLIFALVVFLGYAIKKREKINKWKALLIIPIVLISSILVSAIGYFIWFLITRIHQGYQWFILGEPYNGYIYKMAFSILAVLSIFFLVDKILKKISFTEFFLGVNLFWLISFILTGIFIKEAGFVFLWPLLFSLISLALFIFLKEMPHKEVILIILQIPAVLLGTDLVYLLNQAIPVKFIFINIFILSIFSFITLPLLKALLERGRMVLFLIMGVAFIGLMAAGSISGGFSESRPKPGAIFYAFSQDQNKAFWLSCDNGIDRWNSQFFNQGGGLQENPLKYFFPIFNKCLLTGKDFLRAKAPLPDSGNGPSIKILSDSTGNTRKLTLRVSSQRRAKHILLFIKEDSKNKKIGNIVINGQRLEGTLPDKIKPGYRLLEKEINLYNWISMSIQGLDENGLILKMETEKNHKVNILVVDLLPGLPRLKGFDIRVRPRYMMSSFPRILYESSIYSKSYKL